MKKLWIALIGMGLATAASAQLSWENGYVVMNEGDTLRGKIQVNTAAVNAGKVIFKSETVDKIVHKPFQIKGWGMDGGANYESKAYIVGREKLGVFMRRYTQPGQEVQCYEYWNGEGTTGFSMIFLEKQQEMVEVQFGKFKKQLSEYFADNESIVTGLNENKYKKTFDGLLQIIEEYNQSLQSRWN